jgi:hypothetical protein
MKLQSMLATFAVAGTLFASPALAIGPTAEGERTHDRTPGLSSETPPQPDASRGPAGAMGAPTSGTIEGTITSLERESGRFVLDTSDGPVSLVTAPDELTGVQVGDVVQVSLVSDDD